MIALLILLTVHYSKGINLPSGGGGGLLPQRTKHDPNINSSFYCLSNSGGIIRDYLGGVYDNPAAPGTIPNAIVNEEMWATADASGNIPVLEFNSIFNNQQTVTDADTTALTANYHYSVYGTFHLQNNLIKAVIIDNQANYFTVNFSTALSGTYEAITESDNYVVILYSGRSSVIRKSDWTEVLNFVPAGGTASMWATVATVSGTEKVFISRSSTVLDVVDLATGTATTLTAPLRTNMLMDCGDHLLGAYSAAGTNWILDFSTMTFTSGQSGWNCAAYVELTSRWGYVTIGEKRYVVCNGTPATSGMLCYWDCSARRLVNTGYAFTNAATVLRISGTKVCNLIAAGMLYDFSTGSGKSISGTLYNRVSIANDKVYYLTIGANNYVFNSGRVLLSEMDLTADSPSYTTVTVPCNVLNTTTAIVQNTSIGIYSRANNRAAWRITTGTQFLILDLRLDNSLSSTAKTVSKSDFLKLVKIGSDIDKSYYSANGKLSAMPYYKNNGNLCRVSNSKWVYRKTGTTEYLLCFWGQTGSSSSDAGVTYTYSYSPKVTVLTVSNGDYFTLTKNDYTLNAITRNDEAFATSENMTVLCSAQNIILVYDPAAAVTIVYDLDTKTDSYVAGDAFAYAPAYSVVINVGSAFGVLRNNSNLYTANGSNFTDSGIRLDFSASSRRNYIGASKSNRFLQENLAIIQNKRLFAKGAYEYSGNWLAEYSGSDIEVYKAESDGSLTIANQQNFTNAGSRLYRETVGSTERLLAYANEMITQINLT